MKTSLQSCLRSFVIAVFAAFFVAGCATSGNPKDPVEGFNRAMFAFNEGLDGAIIRPVASGYEAVLPSPVRTGVSNFFGNIGDIFIGVNNLFQGKFGDAFGDFGRVVINTTVGILGLFDVASSTGIPKHDEDFGQTFGRWGAGNGAYVVLPVFGPRTTRDAVGLVLDIVADPISNIGNVATRNSLVALRIVDDRATLLPADKVIEEAALDKYSYLRDAYLQRRRSLIHDGNPPREVDPEADAEQLERPAIAAAGSDPVAAEPVATIAPAVVAQLQAESAVATGNK
jgi:phospholipid-binding lipoprotein MlaA